MQESCSFKVIPVFRPQFVNVGRHAHTPLGAVHVLPCSIGLEPFVEPEQHRTIPLRITQFVIHGCGRVVQDVIYKICTT